MPGLHLQAGCSALPVGEAWAARKISVTAEALWKPHTFMITLQWLVRLLVSFLLGCLWITTLTSISKAMVTYLVYINILTVLVGAPSFTLHMWNWNEVIKPKVLPTAIVSLDALSLHPWYFYQCCTAEIKYRESRLVIFTASMLQNPTEFLLDFCHIISNILNYNT